ncbi:MAG: formate dehydrogenase accessory sulfurtransferase FdhD [Deltaproteobacteria bacterium]|nr:formate dehydrogenase accessory sulfurtransferase FdhD [Deltaproteobacteria bacterium]
MKRNNFITVDVVCYDNGKQEILTQNLIKEEPLLIEAGRFCQTITRTPGDDIAFAAGVCFMQKIIELPEQILSAKFYSNAQPNKVIIKLSENPDKKEYNPLNVKTDFKISIKNAKECVIKLRNSQMLHNKTGSAHAAMLFDYKLNSIAFAEDVGRHNAFDKAIGKVFMEKNLNKAPIAAVSCRINYEMITKAKRASIPIIIGQGKPTSKAVNTALSYNISIAWMGKKGDFFIFTGKNRFLPDKLSD